ncbi:MAG TPA: hypothetical protein VIM70_20650 [Clostridium sp.]|uniref:hypothetical protein n=1 Tax=Clostridium sp. TaxID=1506 RepID=UPI002F91D3E7
MLKETKIIYSTIIAVLGLGLGLGLSVIALTGPVIVKNVVPRTVVYSGNMYTSDVLKPQFLTNNSDVVIVGKIINKNAPAKGIQPVGQKNEVIYTDTNVKVEKIISNKTSDPIKPGDTLVVRSLGGTVDNLTMRTDTETVLKQSDNKVLLFLAEPSKDLTLPTSNTPVYAVVGGFHGSFSLTSDGNATRDVSGEKLEFDDLTKSFSTK